MPKKIEEAPHSEFAFSASPRWMRCAGSMAYPENSAQDKDSGSYADEGTAAHTLAAYCLKAKRPAAMWVGETIKAGKRKFVITEEFAEHVQTYVDDVERRAMGGNLLVEQRVSLDGVEGFDASNYGTSDAVMALPAKEDMTYGVVEDLKFGQGEKVYAWTPAYDDALFTMERFEDLEATTVEPNFQLMMYALACLADIRLLVDDPLGVVIVINQPRLDMISELWVPIAVLERFALFAAEALKTARVAKVLGVEACEKSDARAGTKPLFFNAGEKQCRWCKAPQCKARDRKVEEETGADFEIIADKPPAVAADAKALARSMLAVPFVAEWCRNVMAKAAELVSDGAQIVGPDKKPYKIVEGDLGKRKWSDIKKAEAALLANLPREKVYTEQMITAPAAGKLLNKKATKETWNDVFAPLINRAPGKPVLALGSDPRPPYSPAASAEEFEVEEDGE
jgi:Protein of unknown function (DUF2800)